MVMDALGRMARDFLDEIEVVMPIRAPLNGAALRIRIAANVAILGIYIGSGCLGLAVRVSARVCDIVTGSNRCTEMAWNFAGIRVIPVASEATVASRVIEVAFGATVASVVTIALITVLPVL